MHVSTERTISIVEAARLIFRTASPSDKQVRRIYEQMKSGALKVHDCGGPPLKWTTTESALAEFLAAQREARSDMQRWQAGAMFARQHTGDDPPVAWLHADDDEAEKLRNVYRNIWRDYFLAVMLRRRMAHHSITFRRWVVVGQIAMLISLVGLFAGGLCWTFQPILPGHAAVMRWIDDNTDNYQVTRWFPAETTSQSDGVMLRVQYRYQRNSRRTIHTDRKFRVVGKDVTEVLD